MNSFSVSQVDIGEVKVLMCRGRMEGDCYQYCKAMISELLENNVTKILFDMGDVELICQHTCRAQSLLSHDQVPW